MNRDAAISAAISYLGTDADGFWVESATRISESDAETLLAQFASALGRVLNEFETRITLERNRDHWLIQFVSMPTDHGDTPQGPCVTVFDDGEISHHHPM